MVFIFVCSRENPVGILKMPGTNDILFKTFLGDRNTEVYVNARIATCEINASRPLSGINFYLECPILISPRILCMYYKIF